MSEVSALLLDRVKPRDLSLGDFARRIAFAMVQPGCSSATGRLRSPSRDLSYETIFGSVSEAHCPYGRSAASLVVPSESLGDR